MQNLNPIRIVARRGRDMMLIGAASLMGGLVVSALGLFVSIVLASPVVGVIFLILGLVLVVIGVVVIIRGLTLRRDNDEARVVGEALSHELDQRYFYIRNIGRRGLGYIDALLIGPPGALVFRITDSPGSFLNERTDWLEQTAGRSFTLRHNFTRECVVDIHALRDYLAKRGLNTVPVYGIIVFVNPRTEVSTRQPVVPVAQLSTLKTVLQRDYLAQDRIAPDLVQKTVDAVYK
ncbi:MAG: NERD domain-containing protein [Aggregatilineales bacterium]